MPEQPSQQKPTESESLPGYRQIDCPKTDDPVEFLLAVMNDQRQSANLRVRAAIAATHAKKGEAGGKGELGKKENSQQAAERVSSGGGRFSPGAPPRLVVVNSK